ncbi:hypothetical protein [Paraburkholderia sp. MM5482-R1]|uniref:hypothetical protein n=1 Tax=unclassified Paraburkholderia TaxID=2615204 RepID=UPI003D1D61FB
MVGTDAVLQRTREGPLRASVATIFQSEVQLPQSVCEVISNRFAFCHFKIALALGYVVTQRLLMFLAAAFLGRRFLPRVRYLVPTH